MSTKTRAGMVWLLWLAVGAGVRAQRFELKSVTAQRFEITSRLDQTPDREAEALLAPYQGAVDSLMAPVLGFSSVQMRSGRPESLLSNWVADVLREASVRYGRKADMGLCNMGGLRSAMPKGKVTRGDVLAIAPFENMFCVLSLRGADLQTLMEQIAAVGGEGVSGVRLEITPDGKLIRASVDGKPINPEKIYTVATLDYLAEGNDKMEALRNAVSRQLTTRPVRDVLMDYIVEQDKQGRRLTARLEGRITVKEP